MIAPTSSRASIVDRRVGQLGGHASAGRAADLDGLELPPVGHAAADLVDDLPDGHAHRHLDQPAAADLAGQGEDLGPLAVVGAQLGELLGPVAKDPGHQA